MTTWKIRHRAEGWTGTAERMEERQGHSSTHTCGLVVFWFITQDAGQVRPDGFHFVDPSVESLDELEFLEEIP